MAYKIQISEEVENDIDNALSYIAKELGSPIAMGNLADGIESTLDALSINPCAYPIDKEASEHRGTVVRKINVKKYWLLYSVDKEVINIVAFFHERQNKIFSLRNIV